MFGWLKKWSGKERRAREEQEVKDATERAMVMARATAARREREKKAQAEADQARQRRLDAERAHCWEVARRAEEDRHAQASMLLQEMAAQREAKRKPLQEEQANRWYDNAPVIPLEASTAHTGETASAPLTGKGGSFDGGGASADWSAPDSQSGGDSSSDSSSDGGSGGGGND